MRSMSRLIPVVLCAVALVGCGRAVSPAAPRAAGVGATVGANAVAPDDAKVLAEDDRRAQYWAGDAVRIMAIHTTALNTTAISASGNVYLSAARYHDSKPCVFVGRHYGFKAVAQFTELADYNRLAFKLKPLPGAVEVTATAALNLAKTFQPAAAACPSGKDCPSPAPAAKQVFLASRAILVQSAGAAAPEWRLYGANKKYAVNTQTKEVTVADQQNPGDPLNEGDDVDVQRASAVFLPTSLTQANNRSAPVGTN